MIEKIATENAPQAIGPYSQAVKAGSFLYLSGMMPIDPATNQLVESEIAAQTTQIMKNIDALLNAAGYTFADTVKTTCYLADMNDFAVFNEIYARYFTGKPARACVAVKQLPKAALVEVEVVAYQ
jgi:2-iminobutanoate/2-iminopropanoate deaminase